MKYSISKEAMTIIVKELEATKGRCEIELMGLPLARSNPEDPSYQYWFRRLEMIQKALRELRHETEDTKAA